MDDWPVPDDAAAWLTAFEAHLRDRDNEQLEQFAGLLLLEILKDRGIDPGGTHARNSHPR